MFEPFVESLELDCTVQVRISDNVLDEGDWSMDELIIRGGVVTGQRNILKRCYRIPTMVGWTIRELIEWTQYNSVGRHPEQYNEISK